MKLLNNYNKVILEELLAEDRNQAKAILKKAGITDGGWKLKPEHQDPESEENKIFQVIKKIAEILNEVKAIGDLGFWTKEIVDEYLKLNADDRYLTPALGVINQIKGVYEFAKELKINPKEFYTKTKIENPGITIPGIISKLIYDINLKWDKYFVENYVPKEVIETLKDSGDYRRFLYQLSQQTYTKSARKKLIKLHRKLSRFMPYDTHGNKRSDEYVASIIEYIKNIDNPGEYGTEDDIKMVKDSSNVIWEGDGQMVIQITKEDSISDRDTNKKNEKICHGSENWCIINDPSEYWKDNAGESTYVLFNKDLNNPYNRIAIIHDRDDFGYWDEDDHNITSEMDGIVPNLEEIKDAIRENGDLSYNYENDWDEDPEEEDETVLEIERIKEEISDGETISEDDFEEYLDEETRVTYLRNKIEKLNAEDDDEEDLMDNVYSENLIPRSVYEIYYRRLVHELNNTLNPNPYLSKMPVAQQQLVKSRAELFIDSIKNNESKITIDKLGMLFPDEIKVVQDYVLANYKDIPTNKNNVFGIIFQRDELIPDNKEIVCDFMYKYIFVDKFGEIGNGIMKLSPGYLPESIPTECKYEIYVRIARKLSNEFLANAGYLIKSDFFEGFFNYISNSSNNQDVYKMFVDELNKRFNHDELRKEINLPDNILEKIIR